MERRKHDNLLFYADPDDPRLYLYKDPRIKWMGVTLNFAHPRAWRVSGIVMGVSLLPIVISPIFMLWTRGAFGPWPVVATLAVVAAWSTVVCIHFFRAAARELRQHGERRNTK